jgi:hypothetical protein
MGYLIESLGTEPRNPKQSRKVSGFDQYKIAPSVRDVSRWWRLELAQPPWRENPTDGFRLDRTMQGIAQGIQWYQWLSFSLTHRLHGAGIYTNIGGKLMGSMLPYIAAPWILWVMIRRIFWIPKRTKAWWNVSDQLWPLMTYSFWGHCFFWGMGLEFYMAVASRSFT